jgi:hypothetical protein
MIRENTRHNRTGQESKVNDMNINTQSLQEGISSKLKTLVRCAPDLRGKGLLEKSPIELILGPSLRSLGRLVQKHVATIVHGARLRRPILAGGKEQEIPVPATPGRARGVPGGKYDVL